MYAVLSLVWRLFSLYGFTDGLVMRIALLLILVGVATLAGRSLRLTKAADILPYSAGWLLIAMAFDKILVLPVAGVAMYADVNIWVGYVLILTIPLLAPFTRARPEPAQIT